MCDELPIIFLTFETQASAHKLRHTYRHSFGNLTYFRKVTFDKYHQYK